MNGKDLKDLWRKYHLDQTHTNRGNEWKEDMKKLIQALLDLGGEKARKEFWNA